MPNPFTVLGRILQFFIGLLLVSFAVFFPYKLRVRYNRFIANLFHFPYVIFGALVHFLFRKLNIDPEELYDKEK